MDPEAQEPRTIAVDIYQEPDGSYCATIGNGWIRCGGKTEYEAALRALTELDGQLDGVSALRARIETVERLQHDLTQQYWDLSLEVVQDLMPTITAEVLQRFPTATVTLDPNPNHRDCGMWIYLKNTGLDPECDEAYRWTAEIEQRLNLDPLRCWLSVV